jgi:hypothetical protein
LVKIGADEGKDFNRSEETFAHHPRVGRYADVHNHLFGHMTMHSNIALLLSIVGTVVGFILLFVVTARKADDPKEFRPLRMLGLLLGCLLSPSPLYLLALRAYPDRPGLFAGLASYSFVLCPFSLYVVGAVLKLLRRDVRQY